MPWLKSFFSKQDDFTKAFALSALFHLLVISFFIVKLLVFSKPLIDLSQAISVNLSDLKIADKLPEKYVPPVAEEPQAKIEPAEEPDVAPEKEKPATKKPEKLPVKPVPEKEEVNLSKVKNKQKEALDKIKKMSALAKIEQELKDESQKNAKPNVKKAPRMVAAGSALTGLDKIAAAQYLQLLDARIKETWTLPQWLMSKNLKAQVLVKFNTLGQIIATKLLVSSGNSTYDNYCLQAINNAAPFPKAPDKFSEKFSVDGLVVGFPE